MKTLKLVLGILSIIFFVFVTFQSCTAGLANSIAGNGELSGSAGLLVALLMLPGGIVSIATRNSRGKGGDITLVILFGIATIIGFSQDATIFKDLKVWGGWCAINTIVAILSMVTKGRKKDE